MEVESSQRDFNRWSACRGYLVPSYQPPMHLGIRGLRVHPRSGGPSRVDLGHFSIPPSVRTFSHRYKRWNGTQVERGLWGPGSGSEEGSLALQREGEGSDQRRRTRIRLRITTSLPSTRHPDPDQADEPRHIPSSTRGVHVGVHVQMQKPCEPRSNDSQALRRKLRIYANSAKIVGACTGSQSRRVTGLRHAPSPRNSKENYHP